MFGTKHKNRRFLVPICTGETLGAFGLTEPNAGSDAGGTETEAVLKDGEWIVNGSKCYITNASYAKTVPVTAVTDKKDGRKEISAIILETSDEGFTVNEPYEKMGLNASNTTEIYISDVHVPETLCLVNAERALNSF